MTIKELVELNFCIAEIEVEVKWNEISSELYENEGKFTVEGIVEGSNIKAICEVVV